MRRPLTGLALCPASAPCSLIAELAGFTSDKEAAWRAKSETTVRFMESTRDGQTLVQELMAAIQNVGAALPAAPEPAAQAGQAGRAQG